MSFMPNWMDNFNISSKKIKYFTITGIVYVSFFLFYISVYILLYFKAWYEANLSTVNTTMFQVEERISP